MEKGKAGSKGQKKFQGKRGERPEIKDPRFAKALTDPRFRRIKSNQTKVKIDDRFAPMLTNPEFQISSKYDSRGKKVKVSARNPLKKYYEVEEKMDPDLFDEEGEENDIFVESDSEEGSEEESDSEGEDQFLPLAPDEDESDPDDIPDDVDPEDLASEESEEEIPTGEATYRFAVQNYDWEKLRAEDFLALFQSFVPMGGAVKKVSVFRSEIGKEFEKRDLEQGPQGIWNERGQEDPEKLRKYELQKMKYRFAIVECDSMKTSQHVYSQCDGQEFETTANVMDLRFVPDELELPTDVVEEATEVSPDYRPPYGHAGVHLTKIRCSWDQENEERTEMMQRKFTPDEIKEDDFKSYLAGNSESESEPEDIEGPVGEGFTITYDEGVEDVEDDDQAVQDKASKKNKEDRKALRKQFGSLLEEILPQEEEGEEMEIEFVPGLKKDAEKLLQKKKREEELKDETVFESQLRKQKEKKKEKKKAMKQLEEDAEDEQEEAKEKKGRKGKKKGKKKLTEEEEKEKAELELMTMAPPDEEKKKGYNLKSLVKQNKKKRKAKDIKEDDFEVDTKDSRFKALFEDENYAVDPTDKNYKDTAASRTILNERVKRRKKILDEQDQAAPVQNTQVSELDALVQSVKKKTDQRAKRQKSLKA